jgi:hypothetical protein
VYRRRVKHHRSLVLRFQNRSLSALATLSLFAAPFVVASCDSTPDAPPKNTEPALEPGEICDPTSTAPPAIHFDPPSIVVAPGQTRPVRMIVDPDVCVATTATFVTSDAKITTAPGPASLDLRHATFDFTVTGGEAGTAKVKASFVRATDGLSATSELDVEVRDGKAPTCEKGGAASATVDAANTRARGTGDLANANVSVTAAAFARTDELGLTPFPVSVACEDDLTGNAPGHPIALGPAVSFTSNGGSVSMAHPLRREIDFQIPVNPATIPGAARLRHLDILFSGPMAKKPRRMTVANPRIEKEGDAYVVKFSSPWLGTYQASMLAGAGSVHRSRHLTHRAVMGFSMGAGGASAFGMRHHQQFDSIVPLGGPADWTWLVWFVENYATGGFCPASDPNCTLPKPNLYPNDDTFTHTMDFNHWWYEDGNGNGGRFPRSEYVQFLADLTHLRGNPNGENADPDLQGFPAGPKSTDPWVRGEVSGLPAGTDCRITVEPISRDGSDEAEQKRIATECARSRCDPKNAYIAPSGYFDDEYNPDGTKQVISFCDGAQTGVSPYLDEWKQPSLDEARPVNFALAVDLNRNGVRDFNEPVIRSGHEPFDDVGADGLANAQEPGYDAITNPDPNQDDYDPQLNPRGTERDHRYTLGEPFRDYGLDGVPDTATRNVGGDVGEGDGVYTESLGLKNWYAIDPHGMLRGWVNDMPSGPLHDDALARLGMFSDGGVRDLFNFANVSRHFEGAVASRTRIDGTQMLSTAFYNGFDYLPGQVRGQPRNYVPANILWQDVANIPSLRYGNVDSSPDEIKQGDGMHVGTAAQLLYRLETSFYYVANRWPDADRSLTEQVANNPGTQTQNELGITCEIAGRCEKIFTGPKTARTGPIAITLPPGYALAENQKRNVRYPVLYVLHGYGQDPRDLEAVALITNNFMNDGQRSYATRLPKFIVVYVDGRCRVDKNGKPECVQGSFYFDSVKNDGVKIDSWFDEVLQYVDTNYRTMPESDVDIVE